METRHTQNDGPVEHLTVTEAADALGVSPKTILRWEAAGKITAIRTLGGHRRFVIEEVERVKAEMEAAS